MAACAIWPIPRGGGGDNNDPQGGSAASKSSGGGKLSDGGSKSTSRLDSRDPVSVAGLAQRWEGENPALPCVAEHGISQVNVTRRQRPRTLVKSSAPGGLSRCIAFRIRQ